MTIARLDFAQWSRSALLRAAVAVFIALLVLALWAGAAAQSRWEAAIEATRTETERVLAREQENIRLGRQESFNPPGAPAAQFVDASLPPAPGVVLAVGDATYRPLSATINTSTRADALFRNVEMGSALSASLGALDSTWVVIVLLPLLVIAFGHDLLAVERDTNRLALLRAQAGSLDRIVWGRLALRLAIPTALVTLAALGALALGAGPTATGLWWLVSNLYLLAWGLIVGVVSVRARSAQSAAATLLLLWLAFVILLPAATVFTSERIAPVSSRLTQIITLREATLDLQERTAELLDQFLTDHPELAGASRSGFARTSFVTQRETEAQLAPIIARYDAERQRQANWKHRLSLLSPSALTHTTLTHVAGTDGARHEAFADQALEFAATWRDHLRDRLFLDQRLSPEEIATLPRFNFDEPPLSSRTMWAIVYLLCLIGGLAIALHRLLRSAELR